MNKAGNTNREVATVENASKGPEYMRKDSIFINDGTPGGTVKFESQVVGNSNYELSKITNTYNGNTVVKATNKVTGEIHSFKNFGNAQTGNSLSVTNANTSLVPFNPNVATGVTVTTSSSARTATGSVGSNLITSGKSVTTLEAPKNPVVKPFIKPKQDIETVKQPAVTSEKPKTVEKSYSQGSNNHNSNKESFNQKTAKNPNRNSAGENYVEKSGGINQEKTFRTPDSLLENKGTNNGRVSYQQSEKDLTKKLQDAYKNNSDKKIEVQESYKINKTAKYGTKGSVRPDNGIRVNINNKSDLLESFEIKNYLVKNYDKMTNVIGKQAIQRANELPKETVQRVIIDARGQSLRKTVQEQMPKKEQVIDDIVRKSNGIIKKENILFWE